MLHRKCFSVYKFGSKNVVKKNGCKGHGTCLVLKGRFVVLDGMKKVFKIVLEILKMLLPLLKCCSFVIRCNCLIPCSLSFLLSSVRTSEEDSSGCDGVSAGSGSGGPGCGSELCHSHRQCACRWILPRHHRE